MLIYIELYLQQKIENGNFWLIFGATCDILKKDNYELHKQYGVRKMAISYRKLWKLLIDKDMKKKDLRLASGISTNALAKLGKNDRVTTDVLEKICITLNCDVGDIMEIVDDATTPKGNSEGEARQ